MACSKAVFNSRSINLPQPFCLYYRLNASAVIKVLDLSGFVHTSQTNLIWLNLYFYADTPLITTPPIYLFQIFTSTVQLTLWTHGQLVMKYFGTPNHRQPSRSQCVLRLWIYLSHPCEHGISATPWGNFFKPPTNVAWTKGRTDTLLLVKSKGRCDFTCLPFFSIQYLRKGWREFHTWKKRPPGWYIRVTKTGLQTATWLIGGGIGVKFKLIIHNTSFIVSNGEH